MRFTETSLRGAWVIDLEPRHDDRGFFARSFCQREFAEHGIAGDVRQANVSFNAAAGTVRGMHFQYPPAGENKVVRVVAGALLDVIVDLRPESPTFLEHVAVELTAANRRSLVVPPRVAHGFMTLTDDVEVLYLMSEFHTPSEAGGLPFDDPQLGIAWPRVAAVVSDQDRAWPSVDSQVDTLRERMRTPG